MPSFSEKFSPRGESHSGKEEEERMIEERSLPLDIEILEEKKGRGELKAAVKMARPPESELAEQRQRLADILERQGRPKKEIKTDEDIRKERFRSAYYESFGMREADLKEYEDFLGISRDDLSGKKILDIGAGDNLKFEQEAKGYGAAVIALNPALGYQEKNSSFMRQMARMKKEPAVAGYAQELPFADEVFDEEFSLFGIPGYLPENETEYRKAFAEIIRTLKPGGEGRFSPINEEVAIQTYFWDLLDDLKEQGHEAYVEKFWLEDKRSPSGKLEYQRLIIRKKEEK